MGLLSPTLSSRGGEGEPLVRWYGQGALGQQGGRLRLELRRAACYILGSLRMTSDMLIARPNVNRSAARARLATESISPAMATGRA